MLHSETIYKLEKIGEVIGRIAGYVIIGAMILSTLFLAGCVDFWLRMNWL